MSVCGILLAAGAGTRLGAGRNKALLPLGGEPLFLHALRALQPHCKHIVLAVGEGERDAFYGAMDAAGLSADAVVTGGAQRRHSVERALRALPEDADILLVHDAARPFPSGRLIRAVLAAASQTGAAVPALPVDDTLRGRSGNATRTLPREGLYRVQTPQGFRRGLLEKAYAASPDALTDDAGLVERLGEPVALVPGEPRNFKITRREDLDMAERLLSGCLRAGTGYDAHRLAEGRALVLCGVDIPHETGLLGHSDADVALHALTDALLGACALGDIGTHFPDSRPEYKGVSSLLLLEKTRELMRERGFVPHQCDLTVLAQRPRLAPYIPQMRLNIARALGLPLSRVSVKATTTEGMGFEGREEGMSAQASALVKETEGLEEPSAGG